MTQTLIEGLVGLPLTFAKRLAIEHGEDSFIFDPRNNNVQLSQLYKDRVAEIKQFESQRKLIK